MGSLGDPNRRYRRTPADGGAFPSTAGCMESPGMSRVDVIADGDVLDGDGQGRPMGWGTVMGSAHHSWAAREPPETR